MTNISSFNSAYGIWLERRSDNNAFSSTTISNITAEDYDACGIMLKNSSDNAFSATSIANLTSEDYNATGIWLWRNSKNNTFSATSIAHLTGLSFPDGRCYGIALERMSDNNAFDSTTVSDLIGRYIAFGILLADSNNNTFSSTTSVASITSPEHAAVGIALLYSSNNNAFNSTTITSLTGGNFAIGIYIQPSLDNTMPSSDNTFRRTSIANLTSIEYQTYGISLYRSTNTRFSGPTSIANLTANETAWGIWLMNSDNNTFSGSTTVTTINANSSFAGGIVLHVHSNNNKIGGGATIRDVRSNTYPAYGIWLLDLGGVPNENNEFYNCNISDISSGAPTTSAGIGISGDSRIPEGNNLFDGGKIFKGDGSPIDYGVSIFSSDGNTVVGFEIRDCVHGVWLSNADNTTIERNIIINNVGSDTGAHVTVGSDDNEIHENCFYDNVLQAYDDGSGNNWDRNFWSPPPGVTGDYTIPGNARTKDNQPLCYCPMCGPQKLPALTPGGMLALLSALSVIAAVSMQLERRKRR